MCNLIAEIEQAKSMEMEELLKAVLRRYAVLYPDWEVSAFSLQRGSEWNAQIDSIIGILQKMKTDS